MWISKKCIRTVDIDDVGDNRHLTFFEICLVIGHLEHILKKESIKMSYDLLVNHLKIPKERLSVTCFEGDEDSERDLEAAEIWKSKE